MTREEFEPVLDEVCAQLGNELQESTKYHGADEFQQRVFDVLRAIATGKNLDVKPTFHPHAFPDIHAIVSSRECVIPPFKRYMLCLERWAGCRL
jgi:hypothetical protein